MPYRTDKNQGETVSPQNAYNAYARNSIQVESPTKLIEMLYEGVLRFAPQAARAIEINDIEKKIYFINRTSAIIMELRNSLSFDNGGDVSFYLDGLYDHQLKLLLDANANNNIASIETVINVTKGLLEAWRETTQQQAI
jgi:flagellar protein FliS